MSRGLPKLQQLGGEAEAIVMAMDDVTKARAMEGVRAVVAGAIHLQHLPDELVATLWAILLAFAMRSQFPGAKPEALLLQIIDGAPTLLGPYRQEVAELIT